jgi:hypothetical protein
VKLEDGLNKYKNLPRGEYTQVNARLSRGLWEKEELPTVADIAEYTNGQNNEKLDAIFNFFDNEGDFAKMATRSNAQYDEDESSAYIRKVMASNNEDISKAGYFYKLLMASADDLVIQDKDCGSDGVVYDIANVNHDVYYYRIRAQWVVELKNFCRMDFDEFVRWADSMNLKSVHVRTPMSCKHLQQHTLCSRCCGYLPHGVVNIGTFTALMVTENATQACLSSMNKGRKRNINELLALRYDGEYTMEAIAEWVEGIVQELQNKSVSARYYEIALISRIREDAGKPMVASMKNSINYSGNIFGAYIFTPNNRNLERLVHKRCFNDNSLKLQIAMNNFNSKRG